MEDSELELGMVEKRHFGMEFDIWRAYLAFAG